MSSALAPKVIPGSPAVKGLVLSQSTSYIGTRLIAGEVPPYIESSAIHSPGLIPFSSKVKTAGIASNDTVVNAAACTLASSAPAVASLTVGEAIPAQADGDDLPVCRPTGADASVLMATVDATLRPVTGGTLISGLPFDPRFHRGTP